MATYQEQIERNRRKKEMRARNDAEDAAKKLSPEQIKNWRDVLYHMVGPYALVMPEEMVQEFRDRFQGMAEQLQPPAADGVKTKEK